MTQLAAPFGGHFCDPTRSSPRMKDNPSRFLAICPRHRAEGVPAVIAPARVPKEEPDRHVEHLRLDAVDQVLAVPIKDHWLTKATRAIRR